MSTVITLDMLRAAGACKEGIAYFRRVAGACATVSAIVAHDADDIDLGQWCGWLAYRLSMLTLDERLALIGHSGSPGHWFGASGTYAAGLSFAERVDPNERYRP